MGRRRGTSAFPVARIKKMMQSDDEVGKIATVTPVLVAKALELMMEYVLKEAAGEATNRDTKTVTPQHLKTCVMANDSFDFLRDVVKSVQVVDEKRRRPKRPRSPSPALEGRRVRRTPVKDDKIGDVAHVEVETDLVEEKIEVVGKVEEEDDYDEDDDNDNEEDSAKRDDENEQVKENEEVVPTSVDSQSATGRMSVSALLS